MINNDVTIFIINIGNLEYSKYSIDILKNYFDYNKINYFILEQESIVNYKKAHPSWVKLLSHKIVKNTNFILCWDLDLLPVNKQTNILNFIDYKKINMCYDSSVLAGYPKYNNNFRFNGGLIGIPHEEKNFFEDLYEKHAPGDRPSYEQYYLNDEIIFQNKDINILDRKLNEMYPIDYNFENFNLAQNKHYTWGIQNETHRLELIKKHHELYFKGQNENT